MAASLSAYFYCIFYIAVIAELIELLRISILTLNWSCFGQWCHVPCIYPSIQVFLLGREKRFHISCGYIKFCNNTSPLINMESCIRYIMWHWIWWRMTTSGTWHSVVPHSVTSQKTSFFIVTAMETSELAECDGLEKCTRTLHIPGLENCILLKSACACLTSGTGRCSCIARRWRHTVLYSVEALCCKLRHMFDSHWGQWIFQLM
jgi:hypothetical protein